MAILNDGIPYSIDAAKFGTMALSERHVEPPIIRLTAKELRRKRKEDNEKRTFAQKMMQAMNKPKVARFLAPSPIAKRRIK